ncbi:hypothetical protein [Acinetobacter baumannii]|uniref:hypothetical protein n=1 Tax=Acinetobacter baumannii TaxID=470 RepID=UPI000D7348A6|nr:hypothetical protein [Acinetobacter baumannii]EKT7961141.1 hypothetical protein [Acinetobacter baumannii]EKU0427501.1 hypothetical protein [Acinetobacter baumannii]EKV4645844.1 hypothetical protein [Acinetobacter baumannii]EKV6479688.1 hypothetical protein [Acinetobacter baumannii]EKV9223678.1 hypothetical protein [Acinetobacter baumannii]
MDALYTILCIVVGGLITYFLSTQFYKLGKNLKERFPIIYRLYVIFLGLILALVLIGSLISIKSCVDDYKNEKRREELGLILAPNKIEHSEILSRIDKAKNENFSDKDIFEMMLINNKYSHSFKKAREAGYSYEEIAHYYNLYVGYDYKAPTIGTMEDLDALIKQHKAP